MCARPRRRGIENNKTKKKNCNDSYQCQPWLSCSVSFVSIVKNKHLFISCRRPSCNRHVMLSLVTPSRPKLIKPNTRMHMHKMQLKWSIEPHLPCQVARYLPKLTWCATRRRGSQTGPAPAACRPTPRTGTRPPPSPCPYPWGERRGPAARAGRAGRGRRARRNRSLGCRWRAVGWCCFGIFGVYLLID